jgi:WbqC-like protein family
VPRRIAISQSNYIPWRGYFDLVDRADEFIVLDDVQYTRQDWRNRNRIKTPRGVEWISVPVQGRFGQRIDETVVSDPRWAEKHWSKIEQCYRDAPAFREASPGLKASYESVADRELLTDINRGLFNYVCEVLGITTAMRASTEFPRYDDPSRRLVHMCQALDADIYLSGPAARDYLDVEAFQREGIRVEWMDYSGYPEYPQLHGPFEPRVSVIDVLLNAGSEAVDLFRPRT